MVVDTGVTFQRTAPRYDGSSSSRRNSKRYDANVTDELKELATAVQICNEEVRNIVRSKDNKRKSMLKKWVTVGADGKSTAHLQSTDSLVSMSSTAKGNEMGFIMGRLGVNGLRSFFRMSPEDAAKQSAQQHPEAHLPQLFRTAYNDVLSGRLATLIVSVAIVANSLFVGFETDMEKDHPDFFLWGEFTFLAIFGVELVVRMFLSGLKDFFWGAPEERPWNYLDFTLVTYAFVELVLFQSILKQESDSSGIALLFRTLRLLRLFRLAKLFRFFRDLLLLVVGLINAMKLLFWVWLLLVIILFFFGILTTKVIGQPYGDAITPLIIDTAGNPTLDGATDEQKLYYYLGTVPKSMFTLFEIMTTETWPEISKLCMSKMPASIAIILVYMIITTFAMVNVVVAVTVNTTLDSSAALKEADERKARQSKIANLTKFCLVFNLMDENCDGTVSREEFEAGMRVPECAQILATFGFERSDAAELFNILDRDESDYLELLEFCTGLYRATSEVMGRDMLEVHCDIWKCCRQENEEMMGKITHITNELATLEGKISNFAMREREGTGVTVVAL